MATPSEILAAGGLVNADGPGGYGNPSKDAKAHDCELPRLPAVDLKRG